MRSKSLMFKKSLKFYDLYVLDIDKKSPLTLKSLDKLKLRINHYDLTLKHIIKKHTE